MATLQDPRVVPIPLRGSTVHLLVGEHAVLVDAGSPGDAEEILARLSEEIQPEDLELILLTHGHIDHFGSAHELKARTGASIAMHAADSLALLAGRNPPKKVKAGGSTLAIPSIRRCEPERVDVELGDITRLHEYGIAGYALHTPGHTPGSVSVVLENRQALVGDLLDGSPERRSSRAGDEEWLRSIERVLEYAPRIVHRGHGGPLDGAALVAEHDGVATMERVVAVELGLAVKPGDHADGGGHWLRTPPCDLAGLALSGGGIRSATFNLGLLQGLNRAGVLERFQYVSTVSGGGYLGGFWTAWRYRGGGGADGAERPVLPVGEENRDAPEVRHLREFGNFLNPRLGLLSVDTGRMLVSGLSSTLPALLSALSVIVLAACAWLVLARGLLAAPTPVSLALFVAITGAVLALFEREWNRRQTEQRGAAAVPDWRRRQYRAATVAALAATGACWYLILAGAENAVPTWTGLVPTPGPGSSAGASMLLFAPAAAWGAGVLVFVALRWIGSRAAGTFERRTLRSAFDRGTSRLLFLTAVWTTVTALWLAGVAARSRLAPMPGGDLDLLGYAGFTATAGALFTWAQKLFSRSSSTTPGTGILSRLKPLLPQLLAYLTLLCFTVAAMAAVAAFPLPMLMGAASVALAALLLLDPNQVGLHSFYAARLARAYLGASNLEERGNTDECASDDAQLRDIGAALSGEDRRRPVHLICCAANDLGNRDSFCNLHRGAMSATLSPYGMSVGDDWSPWPAHGGTPTLSSAITASGAAFNSQMGSKSMELGPAVTFLMTAFNLRLGLWTPHPRHLRGPRASRFLAGIPFFKEMFGISLATGADVHLSDGGHFENMALYELIRRHCRYIVAADCGMDGERSFEDFGNLVRRVREDFGVEIDIDLTPLRTGEGGLARQSMVAGDIRYPTGDAGVLLLFKPTLVGNEPPDVAQYRRRNPAFPHETTGDQFYDEAQWESYRALGEHSAETAFRFLGEPASAPRIFAQARREWQPIPDGFADRISRISGEVAALNALLNQPGCEHLRGEIFREVDEMELALHGRGALTALPGPPRRTLHDLSSGELRSALSVVRQGLQTIEQIYYSEDLETNHSHPLYLGVMNYCARWAYAPLVRTWWPLQRTLCSARFGRFMQARFGLAGRVEGDVRAVATQDERGFALESWRMARRAGPAPGERLLAFDMRLGPVGEIPVAVQAALVLVRPVGSVLFWNADDFFVPPGLWGAGVGDAFLSRLVATGAAAGSGACTHLLVRAAREEGSGAVGSKAEADRVQLYRAAGFATVAPADDGSSLRLSPSLPPLDLRLFPHAEGRKVEWMAKDLRPSPGASGAAAAPLPCYPSGPAETLVVPAPPAG